MLVRILALYLLVFFLFLFFLLFFLIHGLLYRLPDTLAAQTQEGPREHGIKNNQLRERLSEEMFYRWHWIFTAGYL